MLQRRKGRTTGKIMSNSRPILKTVALFLSKLNTGIFITRHVK